MRAILIRPGVDGPTLAPGDVPEPEPGPTELKVAVHAAALNRADLRRKASHYGHADTDPGAAVAGLELAGEVVAAGHDVRRFAPGDRVMAMASRTYAEFAVVDYRLALPVPDALDWPEASACPVAFLTAHDALVTNARLRRGESVLVQAVTAGVGIAAIQLAKLRGAGTVFGTSSSSEKLERLSAHGLDVGIDSRAEDFGNAILERTSGVGVNVIIDNLGRGTVAGHLACIALGGRWVTVGRMAGFTDEIDLDKVALKRIHLIGVTFRTRSVEEHAAVVTRFETDHMPDLANGRLRPLVDRIFPLEKAVEAQAYMASNQHLGKIVLAL